MQGWQGAPASSTEQALVFKLQLKGLKAQDYDWSVCVVPKSATISPQASEIAAAFKARASDAESRCKTERNEHHR